VQLWAAERLEFIEEKKPKTRRGGKNVKNKSQAGRRQSEIFLTKFTPKKKSLKGTKKKEKVRTGTRRSLENSQNPSRGGTPAKVPLQGLKEQNRKRETVGDRKKDTDGQSESGISKGPVRLAGKLPCWEICTVSEGEIKREGTRGSVKKKARGDSQGGKSLVKVERVRGGP